MLKAHLLRGLAIGVALVLAGAAPIFAGFAGTDVFLPMAGRQAGVFPSNWYTTVWIYNPGAALATARVYLLVRNTANPSPPWVDVPVAPGDTAKIENIVESLFHQQVFGALRVTCGTQKLVVTSRVYSKGAGAGEKDSVGQDFAGVPSSFAIGNGESTEVIGVHQTEPSADSDYRFNFGFVETTGHSVSVKVTAFDETGLSLGTTPSLQVREFSQRQLAFKDYFPAVSSENVRLQVDVVSGSGRIIAYGSSIANGSQDPTTFEMQYRDSLLGITNVQHDATLTGDGTAAAPLGVAPGSSAGQVLTTVSGASPAPGVQAQIVPSVSVAWASPSSLSLGLTAGVVPFGSASGGLAQDPAGMFWDLANHRLGIGTTTPRAQLELSGKLRLAATAAAAGSPTAGVLLIGDYAFLHGFGSVTNTFVGPGAGNFTNSGDRDTASGYGSLSSLTSGSYNTAVGAATLHADTTGSFNTATGIESLYANGSGTGNTASGYYSLHSNTAGGYNTAVGGASMYLNTEGTDNTAVGSGSLYSNVNGSQNTAVGETSLNANVGGSMNTAVGAQSLHANIAGNYNTALGDQSGLNATGNGNVFLGYSAGSTETGSNRLYIANDAGTPLIFGQFDTDRVAVNATDPTTTLDVNGSVRVRGLAGTGVRGVFADPDGVLMVTVFSDSRLKKDVVDLSSSMDVLGALERLHGVSYSWDTAQSKVEHYGDQREVGVLAQDVESVLPELVSTDRGGYKSVDYARLTAFLIEVARTQQKEIEELRAALGLTREADSR